MPRGVSKNITNISGKIRNNTLMYGRVVNGQQFISTVRQGWDNVPSLEQMCLRIRWRYFQQIWPVFWDWLQGADFFIEKYGEKAKELFLYYEDSENAGYYKSNAFKPQLRLDWEYNPGDYGVADYTEENPPDGGLLQWWFNTQSEAGITIYGAVKYYRTFKMLAKGYLWHVFINRANYLKIPVGYKDPVTGKIVITGYKISAEGAWLFKQLGITYYEQTEEGYKQLLRDVTKVNFLILKDEEGGSSPENPTPPGGNPEGGGTDEPGGTPEGGGTDEPGGNPEGGGTPEGGGEPEDVPADRLINEYLARYDWLQGDGLKAVPAFRPIVGSNTSKATDVIIRAKIRVSALDSAVGTITNICGDTVSQDGTRYRKLNLAVRTLSADKFELAYLAAAPNVAEDLIFRGEYSVGDVLSIEAAANYVEVNDQTFTNLNSYNDTINLSNLQIFTCGSAVGGKIYKGELALLEYWSKGACNSSLKPCKVVKELPAELSALGTTHAVGVVGLWDSLNNKFHTSSTANGWAVSNDQAAEPDSGGSTPPAEEEPETPTEPDNGGGSTPPAEEEPAVTSRPGDSNSRNFEYRAIDTGVELNGKRIWISDRYAGADSPTSAGEWYTGTDAVASNVVEEWYGEGWMPINADIVAALNAAKDQFVIGRVPKGYCWTMKEDVYFMGFTYNTSYPNSASPADVAIIWADYTGGKIYNVSVSATMSRSAVSSMSMRRLLRGFKLV